MQSQLSKAVIDANDGSSQLNGSSLTPEQIQTYNELLNKFGTDFAKVQNSVSQAQTDLANPSWEKINSDLQTIQAQLSTAQLDFENIDTKFIPSIAQNTNAYSILNSMADKIISDINQAQVTLLSLLQPIQAYISNQPPTPWYAWLFAFLPFIIIFSIIIMMFYLAFKTRNQPYYYAQPYYSQPYYTQPYYADRPYVRETRETVVSNAYVPAQPALNPIRVEARGSEFQPISPIRIVS